MTAGPGDATPFVPDGVASPARLAEAAAGCRGCELYRDAERTVFGEGPAKARVVLVGEQPGDQEDRQGHPFVGPAGCSTGPSTRPASTGGPATSPTR